MLTPDGQAADNSDKVMLHNVWALALAEERATAAATKIIFAGMGKPTAPLNMHMVRVYIKYWQALAESINQSNKTNKAKTPKSGKKENPNQKQTGKIAVGYGAPQGDEDAGVIMAKAMTAWYGTKVDADNILPTVGGAGGLRAIFATFNFLNKEKPYRVITPFPHYTMYGDRHNRHVLHPIDVFSEPGYQLTAKALENSILSALELEKKDGIPLQMFLFSNPSNPLGTVIPEAELLKIIAVLKKYPKLKIVMDEAYAEMYWNGDKIPSLITLAPELKERTIILRSATKGLSAAGERLAIVMAFDKALMTELCATNIAHVGHAPRSAQIAYAKAMEKFTKEEAAKLKAHYHPKTQYVAKRLEQMGAQMPDPKYKIDATFYVLGDFSDLLGQDIPEAAKRALGEQVKRITTGEELAYSLLFKEGLMVSPLSFYGMDTAKEAGILRITCADDENTLKEMMDRLDQALLAAREAKALDLGKEIAVQIEEAKPGALKDQIVKEVVDLPNAVTCLDYKLKCVQLKALLDQLIEYNKPALKPLAPLPAASAVPTEPTAPPALPPAQKEKAHYPPAQTAAQHRNKAINKSSFFKELSVLKTEGNWSQEENETMEWQDFVNQNYKGKTKELLLAYTDEKERGTVLAWATRSAHKSHAPHHAPQKVKNMGHINVFFKDTRELPHGNSNETVRATVA